MSNPNLYKNETTVDFSSIVSKLPFKSIFDVPTIKKIEQFDINLDPRIAVDNLKNVRDKPLQSNSNLTDTKESSLSQTSGEKINNILESNLALKQNNYELFREINGRYPNPLEQQTNTISATLSTTVASASVPKELITIQFDDPYTTDKIQFDEYIKNLISQGANYKILPQADGSIIIQHTKTITDQINKTLDAIPTTIEAFIQKYEIINDITGNLNVYKLDSMRRDDIITGLKLFQTPYTGITNRAQLLRLLKNAVTDFINKLLTAPSVTTSSVPSSSLQSASVPSSSLQSASVSDVEVAQVLNGGKRNSNTLSQYINANMSRLNQKQLDALQLRLDEFVQRDRNRLTGNSSSSSSTSSSSSVSLPQTGNGIDSSTSPSSSHSFGVGPSSVGNRMKIAIGEIRAGNDSRQNLKQLMKDSGKKRVDIRALIKNLL